MRFDIDTKVRDKRQDITGVVTYVPFLGDLSTWRYVTDSDTGIKHTCLVQDLVPYDGSLSEEVFDYDAEMVRMIDAFDEASPDMVEFRLVSRHRGLMFYSEHLTREFIHEKIRKDVDWTNRFLSLLFIEGRTGPDADWTLV